MRSWKTTLCGGIAAAASFVAFSPQTFKDWPLVVEFAKFAMVGGLASFGIFAKDSNVSGVSLNSKDNASK